MRWRVSIAGGPRWSYSETRWELEGRKRRRRRRTREKERIFAGHKRGEVAARGMDSPAPCLPRSRTGRWQGGKAPGCARASHRRPVLRCGRGGSARGDRCGGGGTCVVRSWLSPRTRLARIWVTSAVTSGGTCTSAIAAGRSRQSVQSKKVEKPEFSERHSIHSAFSPYLTRDLIYQASTRRVARSATGATQWDTHAARWTVDRGAHLGVWAKGSSMYRVRCRAAQR